MPGSPGLPGSDTSGDTSGDASDTGDRALLPEVLTDEDRAIAEEGLQRINAERALMGLAPVVLDDALTRAAINQARYFVTHYETPCQPPGLGAHEQVRGCAGFVAETAPERVRAFGYTEHPVSECLGHSDANHATRTWLESVYHRSCINSPHAVAIGYADVPAPWGTKAAIEVGVDFDAGQDRIARWPPPGYAAAAASWDGFELPEPPVPPGGWPSGPVIGLTYAWRPNDDTRVSGAVLTDDEGPIPSLFYDPGELVYLPAFFLYAEEPLPPGRDYCVTFEVSRDGDDFDDSWCFSVP